MPKLEGTKTHENLKEAFAGESQANRRYLYFAKVADVEGYPEVAGLFKDTADGETGHAHGHLDFLKQVGDPATGQPIGDTLKNLKSAVVRVHFHSHHPPRKFWSSLVRYISHKRHKKHKREKLLILK